MEPLIFEVYFQEFLSYGTCLNLYEIRSVSLDYLHTVIRKKVFFFQHKKMVGGGGGEGWGGRWEGVSVGPQLVCFFFFFPYLLDFCRQWHLYKFLILGDLSTYLFGLVFLCPTSKKTRVGVHWTPLGSIKVGFLKTLFF